VAEAVMVRAVAVQMVAQRAGGDEAEVALIARLVVQPQPPGVRLLLHMRTDLAMHRPLSS
jgi:hypothetical protein